MTSSPSTVQSLGQEARQQRWNQALEELARRRAAAHGLGGPDRIARQHAQGMLTARERIDLLLDPGSGIEIGQLSHSDDLSVADRTPGDGALCGIGRIGGRWVGFHATDATIKGGTGGAVSLRRKKQLAQLVDDCGLPMFEICQAGGGRVHDIMTSRFAGLGGRMLAANMRRPRRAPQLVAVFGQYYAPWYAGAADFVVMTRNSTMAIASPVVIKAATGESTTAEAMGGPDIHARVTGQIDAVAEDDPGAIRLLDQCFSYLPASPHEDLPVQPAAPPGVNPSGLAGIVPGNQKRGFDIRKLIRGVVDEDSFLELAPDYARNMVIGFARVDGIPVGVLGNQPLHLAGAIDHQAFIKARRLIEICGAFRVPLVSFVDTPGVLVGPSEEHSRILAHAMQYLIAKLEGDSLMVSVVVRKGFGLAFWAMGGAPHRSMSFAWPGARVAFMGPEPAVEVAFRRAIEMAPDPEEERERRIAFWRDASGPWDAARLNYIDDIIEPERTRSVIARSLHVLLRQRQYGDPLERA